MRAGKYASHLRRTTTTGQHAWTLSRVIRVRFAGHDRTSLGDGCRLAVITLISLAGLMRRPRLPCPALRRGRGGPDAYGTLRAAFRGGKAMPEPHISLRPGADESLEQRPMLARAAILNPGDLGSNVGVSSSFVR
jgi:hypothetical protein